MISWSLLMNFRHVKKKVDVVEIDSACSCRTALSSCDVTSQDLSAQLTVADDPLGTELCWQADFADAWQDELQKVRSHRGVCSGARSMLDDSVDNDGPIQRVQFVSRPLKCEQAGIVQRSIQGQPMRVRKHYVLCSMDD